VRKFMSLILGLVVVVGLASANVALVSAGEGQPGCEKLCGAGSEDSRGTRSSSVCSNCKWVKCTAPASHGACQYGTSDYHNDWCGVIITCGGDVE